MNNLIAYYRGRVLLAALVLSLAGAGFWWRTSYQPRRAGLDERQAVLDAKQLQIREARTQLVNLGVDGIEDAIVRLENETQARSAQVPEGEEVARSAADMTQALGSAAGRHRVRVQWTRPVESVEEGAFRVDGLQAHVSGRYHDVGAFLTEMLSLRRITQLRSACVEAVPDSLLAQVASGLSGAPTPPLEPCSPEASGARRDSGDPAFSVRAVFTLNWFSLRAGWNAAPEDEGSPSDSVAAQPSDPPAL